MTKRLSSTERRKEILDAALEIIFKKGFFNLTIRNIAEEIGISEAAIYRHFNSKEEIINSLADIVFYQNKLWDKDSYGIEVYDLLEKIMLKQLNILKENPYLTSILFQEEIFSEYPAIREKFNLHRERNEDIIRNIILKGQGEGVVSSSVNPEVFSMLYMGGLRIIILKWRSSNFSYDPLILAKEVLHELFKFLRT